MKRLVSCIAGLALLFQISFASAGTLKFVEPVTPETRPECFTPLFGIEIDGKPLVSIKKEDVMKFGVFALFAGAVMAISASNTEPADLKDSGSSYWHGLVIGLSLFGVIVGAIATHIKYLECLPRNYP